jgi:hypothetical protein
MVTSLSVLSASPVLLWFTAHISSKLYGRMLKAINRSRKYTLYYNRLQLDRCSLDANNARGCAAGGCHTIGLHRSTKMVSSSLLYNGFQTWGSVGI